MCYTLDEIRALADKAARGYNATAPEDARIQTVTLFGSYADGTQDDTSDVDLLVEFSSSVVSFFTLARALEAMESAFDVPVDLVQDPLPHDALLDIGEKVPLYEAA